MSRSRPHGFSLIEVLIAGSITLVVVTAVVGTLAMAFRFISERQLRTTAELVAESHIEFLLATASARQLQGSDCAPVRYTRAVKGDEDVTASFLATCGIEKDTPPTEGRKIDKLTVNVEAEIDRRRVHTSFVTYLVAQ